MAHWNSKDRTITRHALVRASASREGAVLVSGAARRAREIDAFIGWGYKGSGLWAMEKAEEWGIPFRLFEDGFIRSLQPGYGRGALYSLVEDRSGIYYDGRGRSDLVEGLNGRGVIGADLEKREWEVVAAEDLRRYREIGVSKYNWFPGEFDAEALDRSLPEPGVLVVDQTSGDASIRHGGVEERDFEAMLRAALEENPGVPVYVRGHPDHLFRSKRSCLRSALLKDPRVRLVDARLAPWQVFERVERVYVATSLMGLEAILHGVPVVTFGCPFYAGWGRTDDRSPRLPERESERSVAELFHAAMRSYCRYFDPDTLEPCSLSRVLDHLALQKTRFQENAGVWIAFRTAPWRSSFLGSFLASPGGQVRYTRSRRRLRRMVGGPSKSSVLVWGRKSAEGDARTWRVEDGFLRSAGLGAEFHMPLSLIFDSKGIYYDSTRPSDLEELLENRDFTESELREARDLADLIVAKSLTKYNLTEAERAPAWPQVRENGVRILVPGQVECDASIRYGSPRWQTNLELLREVRRRNPDAVVAFKPHPDLVKRLRPGKALTREIEELCDTVVGGLDIVPWLESCDEVHTLTSLSGFEALLRGKKVCCYGVPFYAGWGLTEDIHPVERRRRRLRLEELMAGALLLHPRYVNPATGEFTTAERAAGLIRETKEGIVSRPWHLRVIAKLKRLARGG